jgi:hypothetical protein
MLCNHITIAIVVGIFNFFIKFIAIVMIVGMFQNVIASTIEIL